MNEERNKRAMRKLGQENTGDLNAEGRNRSRIMPLGPHAASRGVGSRAEVSGRIAVAGRRVRRGKNGFALPPGSRKRQCITWRDDEIRASPAPQNALTRVLVLVPDNPAR